VLLNRGARLHQATLENTQRKTTRAPAARVKPVRPILQGDKTTESPETGQTSFPNRLDRFRPDRKNATRGNHLFFQPIDLLIHSTDCNQTRIPLLKGSIPKCIQKGGIESQLPRTPFPEFIQKPPSRSCYRGFAGARLPSKEAQGPHTGHPTRIPQRNAPKTSPQKFQEKDPNITKKTRRTQTSLEEPHRIIYAYHETFIQGLASARSSFPLTRSHHEAPS
jgi:hypothetical protein